jgi:hypothetical protein
VELVSRISDRLQLNLRLGRTKYAAYGIWRERRLHLRVVKDVDADIIPDGAF